MRKREQAKRDSAQAQCDRWNADNPEGTEVTLERDNGTIQHTKTRSAAYVCNSGYAVIFLEGVSGYYILERVKRKPKEVVIEVQT